MNHAIEGESASENEKVEEIPLTAGDFALVNLEELMSVANNPDEKHQYRNKVDNPFKVICGVPKEFE